MKFFCIEQHRSRLQIVRGFKWNFHILSHGKWFIGKINNLRTSIRIRVSLYTTKRMPHEKSHRDDVMHFSALVYAMKFQFPFHRFRVSFIFSRAGYGIKFRFVHSCNGEYATAWKAAREIRSGESFGRVTVKLNIRKFGVPVRCLFSATVERRSSYIHIYIYTYTYIYVETIKCGFSSRRKSRNWIVRQYIYQISEGAG